jgi:hypothetical protein
MMARLDWLDDHRVPCVNGLGVFTGTEIFAEAFGCRVHYPEDNMPYALPCVFNAHEAENIKLPHWSRTPVAELFAAAEALKAEYGGEAVFKLPDMQSPMDVAALIWEKADFYMARLDTPEVVKGLSAKVLSFQTAFLDDWFAAFGADFIAHYPDYYMPHGITLSVDEVGAVGCEMFDTFFLPELENLSARYGLMGIHCCADSQRHWPGFARVPNLALLNLCQANFELIDGVTFFAPITTQMYGYSVTLDQKSDLSGIPVGARTVVEAHAETKDDALRLADKLARLCEK